MSKFTRLGNDLYNGRKSIDFVGRKWLWYGVSAVIMLIAILGLSVKGLNMGIEFVGGAEYKISSLPSDKVTQDMADDLRQAVADTDIAAAGQPIVTTSGSSSIIVQTKQVSSEQSKVIQEAILETTGASAENLQSTEIGASWGKEVAQRSLIGLLVFLVLVVLFIWAYFREWKMSVAAMVALAHDLLITVGVYALSGFEVTPATVTGVLTILGFSLYDTVVVFDKVRENTKNLRQSRTTYARAANLAVNQTLVRSINTSIVALIPVGAILYVGAFQLGSGSLKDLALALFVGMAAGAYSSIFIATPLLVQLKAGETDVQAAEKRAKARAKKEAADRYAAVPAVTRDDDLPGMAPSDVGLPPADGQGPDDGLHTPVDPVPSEPTGPTGRGRTEPAPHRPVTESRSAGRVQPRRSPKSQRGKK